MEMQSLPWFDSIEWEMLETKEIVPAFIPDVRICFFLMVGIFNLWMILAKEGQLRLDV